MRIRGRFTSIQSASPGAVTSPAAGSVPRRVAVSASLGGTIESTSGATMAAIATAASSMATSESQGANCMLANQATMLAAP